MRKFLTVSIPIVFICCCIGAMLSGPILKKPWKEGENILEYIENVNNYVKKENWQEAENQSVRVERAWKSILKRVQYVCEIDEIDDIYNNIARMKGGIKAKDLGIVFSSIEELKTNWYNLGK